MIDLVVAVIAARREGVEKGDHPSEPIELIVRRIESEDAVLEETVLRVGANDPIDPLRVEEMLDAAIERLAGESTKDPG